MSSSKFPVLFLTGVSSFPFLEIFVFLFLFFFSVFIFFFDLGSPGNTFIEYVKGDRPVAWEWNNNLSFGRSNAKISGIRNENPQFKGSDNGLFFPSENTPFTKRLATDKTDHMEYDLLGKYRGKIKTLGALQFTSGLNDTILAERNYGSNHSEY